MLYSKALDLAISRSWVQFPPGQSCVTTLGKFFTLMAPSSITWYWSKDGGILRLGRWPQAWQKLMSDYRRDDLKYIKKVTCGLTACTHWSAPGPTLGNKYGRTLRTLPFYLSLIRLLNIVRLLACHDVGYIYIWIPYCSTIFQSWSDE